MPTYEGLRLKLGKYKRKLLADYRKKNLLYDDFTIISNNCWGGMIYESYNLPKNSPTVGLFFMADDYIKFLSDLKMYVNADLKFIKPEESRWYNHFVNDPKFGSYPIGKLNDVEIFFLHYKDEQDAMEKWLRRCKRINWNALIIKFNDQNCCTESNLNDFINLPFKNKVFFTVKKWRNSNKCIKYIRQIGSSEFVLASYEPFGSNRHFNVTKYINSMERE